MQRPHGRCTIMRGDDPNAAEVRLNRLLNLILESAVEALGFDAATVTARQGDDLATVAATDQRLLALDDAQYESGEGPCLTVLEPHEPISLEDAGQLEDRWEHFSRTAAHLGIRSTLSMHLPVDEADELQASLNLYSRRRSSGEQIERAPHRRAARRGDPQRRRLAASRRAQHAFIRLSRGAGDVWPDLRPAGILMGLDVRRRFDFCSPPLSSRLAPPERRWTRWPWGEHDEAGFAVRLLVTGWCPTASATPACLRPTRSRSRCGSRMAWCAARWQIVALASTGQRSTSPRWACLVAASTWLTRSPISGASSGRSMIRGWVVWFQIQLDQ